MTAGRRQFVRTLAGAGAGLSVAGRRFSAAGQTPVARRQVNIGGRRVRVVDVHCHCVIPEVVGVVKGTPFEKAAAGGGANILGPARLQTMDQQGVDVQALSINAYGWYAADRELARRIVQTQNEGLAAWVFRRGGRLQPAHGWAALRRPYGRLNSVSSSFSQRTMSSLFSMHSYSRRRSSGRRRNVSCWCHGLVKTSGSSIVTS